MPKTEEQHEIEDVIAEETSRGTRHPVKAITRGRRRKIKQLADMLADQACDERAFLAAIRGYGLQEGTDGFYQAMKLWRTRHGKT
ncbi:MAG: hypothetical protein ABSH01_17860 [Terriglobia bacterium]|jgi:hypothetical protein